MRLTGILLVAAVAVGTPSLAASVAIDSNFAFGSGAPFSGSTIVDGVSVDLTSTNTQPFGATGFRDFTMAVSGNDALVSFSFDKQITEFALQIERVRADEFLTGFSIGDPTSISGQLIRTPNGITSALVPTSDFGFGILHWSGLSTNSVDLTINAPNGAVGVVGFGLTPVPLPPAASFLFLGLFAFAGIAFRKRRLAARRI